MNRHRAALQRLTAHHPPAVRGFPARVARVPHYDSAADVPADAPLGAHMTLPSDESPPPGWTPVSSSEEEG